MKARKQIRKQVGGENQVKPSIAFYINCQNSDKEAEAMRVMNEYKRVMGASTLRFIMCEAIIELLPDLISREKKKREKRQAS